MSRYFQLATAQPTQAEPLDNRQAPNNAGGFVYQLDDWKRLDRFLILGSDSNTYYQKAKDITKENATCVMRCWVDNPHRTATEIRDISRSGRAPKNDSAILALALGAIAPHPQARNFALAMVNDVCRTATHLFMFIDLVQKLRLKENRGKGWGRMFKRAIQDWYCDKPVDQLGFQMIKYRDREGYTHKDVLTQAHPHADSTARMALYRWGRGLQPVSVHEAQSLPPQVKAHLWVMKPETCPIDATLPQLIEKYRLPWEAIPTEALKEVENWRAMLPHMGLTAMIRELARMTEIGLLKPLGGQVAYVANRLTDEIELKRARIHPFNVLLAQRVYGSGHGFKGKRTWAPVPKILDSLEEAFYASFKYVEPTGKRILIGLDVSGSMTCFKLFDSPMTVCEGAAALAMTVIRSEDNYHIMAFDSGMHELHFTAKSSLEDVLKKTRNINGGGTDCALPMLMAERHNWEVDAFVVITDNETWFGNTHPTVALRNYRRKSGINAKLIVIGMTATGFTIADPNDAGMLDICGFDSHVPALISDFIRN